jgi:hypothetical protein
MVTGAESAGERGGAGSGCPGVSSGSGVSSSRCISAVKRATSLPPATSRAE